MTASNIREDESNITNERLAADQHRFVVSEEEFSKFIELADTPLVATSKLKALSNRPSSFMNIWPDC